MYLSVTLIKQLPFELLNNCIASFTLSDAKSSASESVKTVFPALGFFSAFLKLTTYYSFESLAGLSAIP